MRRKSVSRIGVAFCGVVLMSCGRRHTNCSKSVPTTPAPTPAQPQPPQAQIPVMPVCDRTPLVRDAIVAALSMTDCAAVTDERLQTIWELNLGGKGLTDVQPGDFSGMNRLTHLLLWDNALTSLPEDVFAGLISLERLALQGNMLTSLPVDIFRGLEKLRELELYDNPLTNESFPPGIFVGLSSLTDLYAGEPGRDIAFPLKLEELSRSNEEIRLQIVIPHGAPGTLPINLRTTARAEVSASVVTIHAGETHSEEFAVIPAGQGWQLSAAWDHRSRYPQIRVRGSDRIPCGYGGSRQSCWPAELRRPCR